MKSLRSLLFSEPYRYEFFQAVRLLQRCYPHQALVGLPWSTQAEPVRFRALPSLTFPPSEVYEILPPRADLPYAQMTVTFFGLYGPSGALPTHYTQLLLDLHRDVRGEERQALREWLDLFNHRLTSLFYRAWEKYRFELPFERGVAFAREPDAFTQALLSYIGLGQPGLRNRFFIAPARLDQGEEDSGVQQPLARIEDLALLHYAGLLAHRPRNQTGLRAILHDYFELPVEVLQFQGQWLPIEPAGLTRPGQLGRLGVDAVAGEKIWEVQGKFRVRLGPMPWDRFLEWLPDPSPISQRKNIFLLMQLVRFYVGPDFDFDVQLVLDRRSVPPCRLQSDAPVGPRLGWNTWMANDTPAADPDDAVFADRYLTYLPAA